MRPTPAALLLALSGATAALALDSNPPEQTQDISFLCDGSGKRPSCEIQLDVPSSCVDADDSSSCPIVFFLHGAGGTIRWLSRTSGVHTQGAIGVYPQSEGGWNTSPRSSNVCEWSDYSCEDDPDEGLFLANIIGYLREIGASGNIYIIGSSNGAALAMRIASNAGDVLPVKGIVTMATQLLASPEKSGPGKLNYNQPSTKSSQVSVLNIMGTEDGLVPYEGGSSVIFGGSEDFVLMRAMESMDTWVQHNGCDAMPSSITSSSTNLGDKVATHYEWQCPEGVIVEHYALHGAGHNAGSADINGVKITYDLAFYFINHLEGNGGGEGGGGDGEGDSDAADSPVLLAGPAL